MAEIFPSEGLDLVLAIVPKNGTNAASTYIGLWGTTFTASTVGTAGNARASYDEPSGGSYTRIAHAAASWGATGAGTSGSSDQPGRKTAGTQATFQTATASWGTVNGFFLGDTSTRAAGAIYFACNFDDVTAVAITTNDVIKITPSWEIRN